MLGICYTLFLLEGEKVMICWEEYWDSEEQEFWEGTNMPKEQRKEKKTAHGRIT